MNVLALINGKVSHFNDRVKADPSVVNPNNEDFITLQVLFDSNISNLDNRNASDDDKFILYHAKQSSIKSMKPANKKITITDKAGIVHEAPVFKVNIDDLKNGVLAISNPDTKVYQRCLDFEPARLSQDKVRATIIAAGLTFKSANCSYSRFPC
jgi:hypothetical protein